MARPQSFVPAVALEQVMHVFWDKGYEGAALSDLMAATGLSKSSLYATFGDKRTLFLTALDAYVAATDVAMERTLTNASPRDGISAWLRGIVVTQPDRPRGCMLVGQANDMAPHDPEVAAKVEAAFARMEEALARAIGWGQVEGTIATPRDPQQLARLIVVAYPGLQTLARAGGSKERLETAVEVLLEALDDPRAGA